MYQALEIRTIVLGVLVFVGGVAIGAGAMLWYVVKLARDAWDQK